MVEEGVKGVSREVGALHVGEWILFNLLNCVWWWWIFRDLEITKGGAARVFEGGDGHGFTQLFGYHFHKVLVTIIAENK